VSTIHCLLYVMSGFVQQLIRLFVIARKQYVLDGWTFYLLLLRVGSYRHVLRHLSLLSSASAYIGKCVYANFYNIFIAEIQQNSLKTNLRFII